MSSLKFVNPHHWDTVLKHNDANQRAGVDHNVGHLVGKFYQRSGEAPGYTQIHIILFSYKSVTGNIIS